MTNSSKPAEGVLKVCDMEGLRNTTRIFFQNVGSLVWGGGALLRFGLM